MGKTLKIGFAVHGRFHAFDLIRELIRLGHEVVLFTNYPALVVSRFGIPLEGVRSNIVHGIAARAADRLLGERWRDATDPILHEWFGGWVARNLPSTPLDVVHSFTGVAEETLNARLPYRALKTIVRGSSHIRRQNELLLEEERRLGHAIQKPSRWMIEREVREYAAADIIFVLSTFARTTFLELGVDPSRLRMLPLGSELRAFRGTEPDLASRLSRIRSGAPLRVLFTGSFSAQKGAVDFARVAEALSPRFEFKVVGPIAPDATQIAAGAKGRVKFRGKVPHYQLPPEYAWADIFVFPTIQDGYAAVLSQAQAAGLPLIATTNCAGPDIVREGETGWIVPIRSPDLIVDRLLWCDRNREALGAVAATVAAEKRFRDWSDVARDFVGIVGSAMHP